MKNAHTKKGRYYRYYITTFVLHTSRIRSYGKRLTENSLLHRYYTLLHGWLTPRLFSDWGVLGISAPYIEAPTVAV
jgi:hypothetical protein